MSINNVIYRRYYNLGLSIKNSHCVCKSKDMLHLFVVEDVAAIDRAPGHEAVPAGA